MYGFKTHTGIADANGNMVLADIPNGYVPISVQNKTNANTYIKCLLHYFEPSDTYLVQFTQTNNSPYTGSVSCRVLYTKDKADWT